MCMYLHSQSACHVVHANHVQSMQYMHTGSASDMSHSKGPTNGTTPFRILTKQLADVCHPLQSDSHTNHQLARGYVHTRNPLCHWVFYLKQAMFQNLHRLSGHEFRSLDPKPFKQEQGRINKHVSKFKSLCWLQTACMSSGKI